jgi:hypothetical protein
LPPEAPDLFADPSTPDPQAILNNWKYWVSGYYDHPDIASRSIQGLDVSKHGTNPSVDNMTAEQMDANFDAVAAVRTEYSM